MSQPQARPECKTTPHQNRNFGEIGKQSGPHQITAGQRPGRQYGDEPGATGSLSRHATSRLRHATCRDMSHSARMGHNGAV